jgi:hypothetical protein
MPRTLQFKRFANTVVANTTGANGEFIIDSTNHTITIHDGVTRGGYEMASKYYVDTNGGSTGDWTWPYENSGYTRAYLGGSQGSWIDGQTPGGLIIYNDSTVTLNSNTAYWAFASDGSLTLPENGTILYTANNSSDWAGTPPTTIEEAIDRLANAVFQINSTGS